MSDAAKADFSNSILAIFYVRRQGMISVTNNPINLFISTSGLYFNMLLSDHVHMSIVCLIFFSRTDTRTKTVISIIGIICQALNILCESQGFNPHFANVYLEAIDFVTIR